MLWYDVTYELQTGSRRYLNDMIYENVSLVEFLGGRRRPSVGERAPRGRLCVKWVQPRREAQLPDSTCSSSHGYAHGLNFEREPGEDARTAMTSESALLVRESPAGYMNDTKLPNLWNGRINAYSVLLQPIFAAILTLNVISGFLMRSKSLILIDDNWAYSYFPRKANSYKHYDCPPHALLVCGWH